VVDIPGIDAVLGMDFLDRFNPPVSWRKRSVQVRLKGQLIWLHAHCDDQVTPFESAMIKL
jgi:hypothetical protein